MKIIKNNATEEVVIKKSKFISYAYFVNNLEEIKNILNNLKEKYKDAKHMCYAYIVNNDKKYSDDKEPNGTAGMPILNILEKNNLNNILVVVIRYFGGIKLGASNLLRAYVNVTKNCLEKCEKEEYIDYIELILTTKISNISQLDKLTYNELIINKEFNENVNYTIKINKNNKNDFIKQLNNKNINYKIKE